MLPRREESQIARKNSLFLNQVYALEDPRAVMPAKLKGRDRY